MSRPSAPIRKHDSAPAARAVASTDSGSQIGEVQPGEGAGDARYPAGDDGAAAAGLDHERAAKLPGPMLHYAHAEPLTVCGRRAQPDPVVANRERQLLALQHQIDLDGAPLAVPDGVADGLLNDPVEVRRRDGTVDHKGLLIVERTRHIEDPLGHRRELLDRREESSLAQRYGREPEGQAVRLRDRLLHKGAD